MAACQRKDPTKSRLVSQGVHSWSMGEVLAEGQRFLKGGCTDKRAHPHLSVTREGCVPGAPYNCMERVLLPQQLLTAWEGDLVNLVTFGAS